MGVYVGIVYLLHGRSSVYVKTLIMKSQIPVVGNDQITRVNTVIQSQDFNHDWT